MPSIKSKIFKTIGFSLFCSLISYTAVAGPPGSAGQPTPPPSFQQSNSNQNNNTDTNETSTTKSQNASSSTNALTGWKVLSPSDANATIIVPANAKYSTTNTNSLVGDVVSHTYTGTDDDTTVVLDYTAIPDVAFIFSGDDSLIDQAKSSYLHEMLAKQTDYEKRYYNGVKGKHLGFASPEGPNNPAHEGQAFFFFNGHTLYIVSVYSKHKLDPHVAEQTFKSLKVTKSDDDC